MKEGFFTRINPTFLVMFLMSVVNLLFMHHYFLRTIDLEVGMFKSSLIDNLIACLLDASVILLISWLITFRRLRASLAITFVITLIWSFVNVYGPLSMFSMQGSSINI